MNAATDDILLPEKQAKQYPPAIMEGYLTRFGLSQSDLKVRGVRYLLKAKIDVDIYLESRKKRIIALEAKVTGLESKVAGLLGFVERFAHLTPPAKARK